MGRKATKTNKVVRKKSRVKVQVGEFWIFKHWKNEDLVLITDIFKGFRNHYRVSFKYVHPIYNGAWGEVMYWAHKECFTEQKYPIRLLQIYMKATHL